MPYKKGQSGNPKGRPVKSRTLTAILETAGKEKIEVNGAPVKRHDFLAAKVWQAVIEGKVVLLDDVTLKLSTADWRETVEFLYKQIDGPPKQEIDMTTQGEKITNTLTEDERITRIATLLDRARARRTGQASDASSG